LTASYNFFRFYRDWDRFAKTEYERLAMEEEGGDDSDVIDAMEGWDSEDADDTKDTKGSGSDAPWLLNTLHASNSNEWLDFNRT